MSWEVVDEGWGRRAAYWAYLLEKHPGVRYVDIACGAGLAASMAARRGAAVSGIDASRRLLAIAKIRTPEADFRAGDMEALPWPDHAFDVATSFNGIWGPNHRALEEAARVVRPGGQVAITFWGNVLKMPGAAFMLPLAFCAPQESVDEQAAEVSIGKPGVAESMFESAGITPVERGRIEICFEFPDAEIAAIAGTSSGPAYAGIQHSGEAAVMDAFRSAAESLTVPDVGVRAELNWGFLVGTVR
jgi:SAM-dependent methyltransferase